MRAEEGRIRLYLADIRPLYEERARHYVYDRVGDERQKKADACKTPRAKAASLAAGFLAQYGLRENGWAQYCVCYDAKGKPQVRRKPGADEEACLSPPPVYISLSHSGDYAVCAVAAVPVGVDIQKKEPVRAGILRHFFDDGERKAFEGRHGLPDSALPGKARIFLPENAQEEFLRLWTAKESFMKLTGEGMAAGFANLKGDLEKGLIRENGGRKRTGCLREYRAPEGYFLTACTFF